MFEPIDLYFADLHRPQTENERNLLAMLMAASREGHLCLELEGQLTSPYVRQYGRLFYLEKNFAYETRILEQLQRLSFSEPVAKLQFRTKSALLAMDSDSPQIAYNHQDMSICGEHEPSPKSSNLVSKASSVTGSPVKPLDFSPPKQLNSEQNQALHVALSNTLSIIEGGPGTGKTFLTSHLVQAVGPQARVVLAAPTGKAAARLKHFNPQAVCGTLHSILGIKSERHLARTSSYVQADLIIVDESSMVDAKLLALFLSSLQVGQRVVFLGDGHQLPPVESGSLFGDLVDLLPTAHLRQCLRSDQAQVLDRAQKILSGQSIDPDHPLSEEFILEKALGGCCILSPVREGPFGVDVLNEKIFRIIFNRMKPAELLAVPILITRTDYEAQLYNGEMGVLWRDKERTLYAQFGERKIPASALPPYELGYVLSVHKSQGSEFDHVVVAVPPGSEKFGREVLYTAVTRAKLSVTLCGDRETIQKTISRSSHRTSGLKQRWSSK